MVNIIASIPTDHYAEKIYQLVVDIEHSSGKALYVSMNKTYKSLLDGFEGAHVDAKNFFFVDTITATLVRPKPDKKCLYLDNPEDIKKLYSGIIKMVKENNIDIVLFDSLSSLTTYQDQKQILHFVSTLLGSLALLNASAVFTCLSSDAGLPLIKQVNMRVDKMMDLK